MSNSLFAPLSSRRLLSALFLVGWVVALPPAVRADEDAASARWLDRLAHMEQLNFRGVLIYSREGHQESLRVTHGRYGAEIYERLEHLDGEHREIIRRDERLVCIQLGQRFERLLHRHLLRAGLDNLDPNYSVAVGAESRVAGRRAVTLDIKPRDDFRFAHRLAVDYETGLLLRAEALNRVGHVLERLQFVDVEISPVFKREWLGEAQPAAARAAADPLPIERVIEEGQMPWRPRWLPPGFTLALAPHRTGDNVLTYSDGLAVMSVFVEPAHEPLPSRAGIAKQGATVAYTRPVEVGNTAHLVLVVGDIPAETAKRVADSVAWQEGPAQP